MIMPISKSKNLLNSAVVPVIVFVTTALLFNMHAQLEAALADALEGVPLIHAVEVVGSETQLQLLGADKGVVGFEIAAVESGIRWPRPPLTGGSPEETDLVKRFADDPTIGDDTPGMYGLVSTLASREIESDK